MNQQLRKLVLESNLTSDQFETEKLEFGLACIDRIAHLLIDERLNSPIECVRQYIKGEVSADTYRDQLQLAKQLAQSHTGSHGIDGAGNAAVSASFAVTKALAGDVINGAEYAAYALVYSYASHTVTNPDAFTAEYQWQTETLRQILKKTETLSTLEHNG